MEPLRPILRRFALSSTIVPLLSSASIASISSSIKNGRGDGCNASSQILLQYTSRKPFSTTLAANKDTTARTKRALNISPHPSFISPLGPTAKNKKSEINDDGINFDALTEQVLFNPPSAAPSVYNTPFIFLPKNDPRRKARLASHLFADRTSPIPKPYDNASVSSPTSSTSATTSLNFPAPVKERYLWPKKNNLTPEDVREIQRLRAEDPTRWSVHTLAKKFNVPPKFIMNCGSAPNEYQQRLREKAALAKARWGPRKKKARMEREKRRKLLMEGKL